MPRIEILYYIYKKNTRWKAGKIQGISLYWGEKNAPLDSGAAAWYNTGEESRTAVDLSYVSTVYFMLTVGSPPGG